MSAPRRAASNAALLTAVLVLCASASTAARAPQTASQLLEQAIYEQDTRGALDDALRLYRQILGTPSVPKDVGADALMRLAEALQKKGDERSTQELTALAQKHPEVERLIRRVGARSRTFVADRGSAIEEFDRIEEERARNAASCCGLYSDNYDPSRPFSVSGRVTRVDWRTPVVVVFLEGDDSRTLGITVGAPTALGTLGWNRDCIEAGDWIRVEGFYGKSGAPGCGESATEKSAERPTLESLYSFCIAESDSKGKGACSRIRDRRPGSGRAADSRRRGSHWHTRSAAVTPCLRT